MRQLEADVVIVGGGAAGTYAALSLHRLGVTPLLVSKGLVGKSGASIFAGNLVVSGRILGNTEDNARDTAEFLVKYHNQFLIDQDYVRQCGQWIADVYYPELEEAGLYIRRDDQGNVVTSPGRIRSIAANWQGNSGVPFMDLRRKQLLKAHVPMLEEVSVTALLQDEDGSVCGVMALDIASGEIFVILAKAVILATGYADRLHWRSTGTREMSADGIAMAARIGAHLVNLEMQWWHTNDVRCPDNWQRMQVYPNPMLGSRKSARMLNSSGEVFFNQQEDDPMAFGPYTVQLKRLIHQVRAGKARFDGGYFAGFDHVDPKELEAYTTYAKLFKQLGLDVGKQVVETAVSAHYRQGGILVDPQTMASTVAGLFVAGGLGGHSNGLIALVTYDGKVAGETVARHIGTSKPSRPRQDLLDRERDRVQRLLRPLPSGGVPPVRVKRRIRQLMWEHMGIEKNGTNMALALEMLHSIRTDMLPVMGLPSTGKTFNHGWLDAIDVSNMVEACILMVHSALNRKESRGPFIRSDYPEMDNENWLAQNILMPREDGEVEFNVRPYELKYWRPDFRRKNNLSVAW